MSIRVTYLQYRNKAWSAKSVMNKWLIYRVFKLSFKLNAISNIAKSLRSQPFNFTFAIRVHLLVIYAIPRSEIF